MLRSKSRYLHHLVQDVISRFPWPESCYLKPYNLRRISKPWPYIKFVQTTSRNNVIAWIISHSDSQIELGVSPEFFQLAPSEQRVILSHELGHHWQYLYFRKKWWVLDTFFYSDLQLPLNLPQLYVCIIFISSVIAIFWYPYFALISAFLLCFLGYLHYLNRGMEMEAFILGAIFLGFPETIDFIRKQAKIQGSESDWIATHPSYSKILNQLQNILEERN